MRIDAQLLYADALADALGDKGHGYARVRVVLDDGTEVEATVMVRVVRPVTSADAAFTEQLAGI